MVSGPHRYTVSLQSDYSEDPDNLAKNIAGKEKALDSTSRRDQWRGLASKEGYSLAAEYGTTVILS
jgi:hypothetical protein